MKNNIENRQKDNQSFSIKNSSKNIEHTRPIHEQSHQPSQIENLDRSDDQAVRE